MSPTGMLGGGCYGRTRIWAHFCPVDRRICDVLRDRDFGPTPSSADRRPIPGKSFFTIYLQHSTTFFRRLHYNANSAGWLANQPPKMGNYTNLCIITHFRFIVC